MSLKHLFYVYLGEYVILLGYIYIFLKFYGPYKNNLGHNKEGIKQKIKAKLKEIKKTYPNILKDRITSEFQRIVNCT